MSVFTVSPPKRRFLDPVLPGMGFLPMPRQCFLSNIYIIYKNPVSKTDQNQMSNEQILYGSIDVYMFENMRTMHIIQKDGWKQQPIFLTLVK